VRHGALFNGIGGFQLAAKWCGWDNVFSVEIDKWCNRVTAQHFPECAQYENIYDFDGTQYAGSIDIISGGFPCQPFSVAGKRKGKDDDRHLWPEMLRVIQEIRPAWVCGENVAGIVNMVLDEVLSDLESIGYRSEAVIVPACATNAPHRRDRVWIIAHSDSVGERAGCGGIQEKDGEIRQRNDNPEPCDADKTSEDTIGERNSDRIYETRRSQRRKSQLASSQRRDDTQTVTDPDNRRAGRHERASAEQGAAPRGSWDGDWLQVATTLCRVDDGLPGPLDRAHRLKALGNAIVPQVAYEIFQAIKKNHDSKENTCTT
jgi:DNA (cytosine-5)-methyltransferase 1